MRIRLIALIGPVPLSAIFVYFASWQLAHAGAEPPSFVTGLTTAKLEVQPVKVDFGRQEIGTLSTATKVRLYNAGNTPVEIRRVTLEGSSAFHIPGNCTNVRLDPGAACVLALRFAPSATGTSHGRLVIANSAGGAVGVDLSGNGFGRPSIGETPAQPAIAGTGSPPPPKPEPQVRSPVPPDRQQKERVATGSAPQPEAKPRTQTRSIVPADVPTATTAIPAFPWPPPAASAEHQIRNTWVTKGDHTKLADVAEKLEAALESADYEIWRYSSVPRGFALATQIEQISSDGTPRSGKERFRTELPSFSDMTLVEFLKALAKAPPGYYRVIVFVVTDTPFSRSGTSPTEKEAQQWLHAGLNRLPNAIGALAYTADYRTTALVYEFSKASKTSPATFVPKSPESGRLHLERAGIWDALTR